MQPQATAWFSLYTSQVTYAWAVPPEGKQPDNAVTEALVAQ